MEKEIKDELKKKSLEILIGAFSIDLDNNSSNLSLVLNQLLETEIFKIGRKITNMDKNLIFSFNDYKNELKIYFQKIINERKKILQEYIDNITLDVDQLNGYALKINNQEKKDREKFIGYVSTSFNQIISKNDFSKRSLKYLLSSFLPDFLDKIVITFRNRNVTLQNNVVASLKKINLIESKVLIK